AGQPRQGPWPSGRCGPGQVRGRFGDRLAWASSLAAWRGDPPVRAVTYLPRRLVMNSSHFKAAIARWPDLLAAPPEISHADIAANGWSAWPSYSPRPYEEGGGQSEQRHSTAAG